MTSKKATTHRKIPAISEAPPPVNPIRTSGYRPKKSTPADYSHWNRFPLLSFDQCLMLHLGVEPGTRIEESSIQEKYDRLWLLIQSCRRMGMLQAANGQRDFIEPSKYRDCIRSMDMDEDISDAWQPVDVSPKHSEQSKPEVHVERYEEAVKVAILMLEEGPPPRHIANHLIPRIRLTPEEFPACRLCESDDSLARSIRNGGGNPLKDPQYLAALRELDK